VYGTDLELIGQCNLVMLAAKVDRLIIWRPPQLNLKISSILLKMYNSWHGVLFQPFHILECFQLPSFINTIKIKYQITII
jgi:hypothetical protein